jgi:hypothetical protein
MSPIAPQTAAHRTAYPTRLAWGRYVPAVLLALALLPASLPGLLLP